MVRVRELTCSRDSRESPMRYPTPPTTRKRGASGRWCVGLVAVGMVCAVAGGGRAQTNAGEVRGGEDAGVQSVEACGWSIRGQQRSGDEGSSGSVYEQVVADRAGWHLEAGQLEVRMESDVGESVFWSGLDDSRDDDNCMVGSGRVRILAPDGRYITGRTFVASGPRTPTVTVWSEVESSAADRTSVIGDGWRMHGSAVVVDLSTDAVEIVGARGVDAVETRSDANAVMGVADTEPTKVHGVDSQD